MYQIQVDPDTMEFTIIKNGHVLPVSKCKNIEWALETAVAVINRTESEIKRREKNGIA